MSVNCSAQLVYGVRLAEDEIKTGMESPDWDELFDKWAIISNGYDSSSDIVFGIVRNKVDEGELTEIGVIKDLGTDEIDSLLEALDTIGINRDPAWHLMCVIS